MNEEQANAVAEALGGSAWNSGGDIWLVRFEKPDGKLVILSDEAVSEYKSEEAFDKNRATTTVVLH